MSIKQRMKRILVLGLVMSTNQLIGQKVTPSTDDVYYNMSLEELMNVNVSVGMNSDLTHRETPSIITIITSDEIKAMGASDLMSILNMVPGLNFGLDVFGVVGMSSRGNWSHEGKVLLLIDGLEMNDISYSNTQFGQHFDASQIDRIEIVRGPGSSLYGGSSALGVIKVISKSGSQLKGLEATAKYGILSDSYSKRNVNLAFGNSTEKTTYSISGYFGQTRRSNLDYTDITGNTTNLKDVSRIFPGMLNGAITYNKLSARVLLDMYQVESPVGYDSIKTPTEISRFNGTYTELKYAGEMGDKLTITPKISFKSTTPWALEKDSPIGYYEVITNRWAPSVIINYVTEEVSFVSGIDAYFDSGEQKNGDPAFNYSNGRNKIKYHNLAIFSQVNWKNGVLPVFVGSRVDNHSEYGVAVSPKLGVTKVLEQWNFKLLYSKAFRAPGVENLRYNPALKPEFSNVYEAQIGYELSSEMSISLNVYNIDVKDPIVYYYNDEFPDGSYINYKSTGTQGYEVEYRYKGNLGFINANYSFYTTAGKNEVPLYEVPNNNTHLLAWPSSKINVYSGIKLSNKVTVGPSLVFMSKRFGLTGLDQNDDYILKKFNASAFLNVNLQWNDILNGLDMGFTVNDISNSGQLFIQPHSSGFAPLSGIGREFQIMAIYKMPF